MKVSTMGRLLLSMFAFLSILLPGQLMSHRILPSVTVAAASAPNIKIQSAAQPLDAAEHIHRMAVKVMRTEPIVLPVIQTGQTGQSVLWLNEALASLQYLPLRFVPRVPKQRSETNTFELNNASLTTMLATNLKIGELLPMSGTWAWRGTYPNSLKVQWNPNVDTAITEGAIMRFQHDHGLDVDGIAGPKFDQTLLAVLTAKQVNRHPYTYVTVSKSGIEHLDVWQSGQKVYTTPANTGIQESQTPDGTFPVYWRLTSQTMSGKNPDGSTYSDPGVPWINYFNNGCAIHGFPRSSYGSQQSLGCVELPIAAAQKVYSLLDYGTLVTIGE